MRKLGTEAGIGMVVLSSLGRDPWEDHRGAGNRGHAVPLFLGGWGRDRELGQLCELLNTHELAIKCGSRRQGGW